MKDHTYDFILTCRKQLNKVFLNYLNCIGAPTKNVQMHVHNLVVIIPCCLLNFDKRLS